MRFITSWERKGELKALREILLRLLKVKFDEVPPAVAQRVIAIDKTEELDRLLEQLIHAKSIEQMGLAYDT